MDTMNPLIEEMKLKLLEAIEAAGISWEEKQPPALRPCGDRRFGDYQANAAMTQAKRFGRNPRELAETVAAWWNEHHAAQATVSVAGPGFLNFLLTNETLLRALQPNCWSHLPKKVENPPVLILDYSSPNVAKSMHVGHIRSTLLGDSLSRVMRHAGWQVITDNHIGDWGTQFGKLIVGYLHQGSEERLAANPIGEMERLYKWAHEAGEHDPALQECARLELKKLQDGDSRNKALWERFRGMSQSAFDSMYGRLNISFDYTLGESFYHPMLGGVVDDLMRAGVASESEGATCVFFDDKMLQDKPFLIRKSDGAFLYSTTDLATLKYRANHFKADKIWYVTDLRQALHFQQLFATAKKWGVSVESEHIGFGSILGQDKRPLKTREGDPIKLDALLDEAVSRALAILEERRADLPSDEKKALAEVLGINSVKYSDLAQNRHLDYVFDWNKMLAFDGNTAPYVLNAYVRIQSIFRKSGESSSEKYELASPQHPRERDLMLHLLQWDDTLAQVAEEKRPHYLCFYLFYLAGLFHAFFESCPVLKSEPALKRHRLALCRMAADTLREGCGLLGLQTIEKM